MLRGTLCVCICISGNVFYYWKCGINTFLIVWVVALVDGWL